MMVADFRVVYKTASENSFARSGSQLGLIWRRDRLDYGRQCSRYVTRQVAAIRAWVTDELMFFVQGLGQFQGLLRRETVEPIRVALQDADEAFPARQKWADED